MLADDSVPFMFLATQVRGIWRAGQEVGRGKIVLYLPSAQLLPGTAAQAKVVARCILLTRLSSGDACLHGASTILIVSLSASTLPDDRSGAVRILKDPAKESVFGNDAKTTC